MKSANEIEFLRILPQEVDECFETNWGHIASVSRLKGSIHMRGIFFIIIALLMTPATAHPQGEVNPEKGGDMSADVSNHKRAIKILFEECFSTGHIERLPDLISSDYQGPNGQRGPAALAATIRSIRTYLPDAHYTLEEIVAEGDRVAVHWRLEGTQDGPFRGFPPTHKHVTTSGMGFFEFKNDRIASSSILNDTFRFMQQIGALPDDVTPPTQPTK
jgi:steroid delta-isomerase-like uncharacterized protein